MHLIFSHFSAHCRFSHNSLVTSPPISNSYSKLFYFLKLVTQNNETLREAEPPLWANKVVQPWSTINWKNGQTTEQHPTMILSLMELIGSSTNILLGGPQVDTHRGTAISAPCATQLSPGWPKAKNGKATFESRWWVSLGSVTYLTATDQLAHGSSSLGLNLWVQVVGFFRFRHIYLASKEVDPTVP